MTRNARHYSIADVRRTYSPAKAREEWYGDWASALIYRPLSFIVTPLFANLGFSANMVTALSLLLGLALPFIAWFGGTFLTVALLAIVWLVFDCVDGNIARLLGQVNPAGAWLDFATDVIFRLCFYLAIGILAKTREGLALCALAFFFAMAARLCRWIYSRRSGDDVYSGESDNFGDRPRAPLRILFAFVSGTDRLLPLLVLAAGYAHRMIWVAVFLLVYSATDFVLTQFSILRRLAATR